MGPPFSPEHSVEILTKDEMRALKFQCDELSSKALESVQHIHKETSNDSDAARLDMYQIVKDHHEHDEVLGQFWDSLHNVPSWVDWEQLERGQQVYYRYGLANLIGFALQGFMGENAATPGVAEVLIRTGGFSTKVVLRRALETFQWLLQVTQSIDHIKPGGEGHTSTARIRLLHASVRQRILRLRESNPEYFDIEHFGLPINRLDDIHSIALFSCNPMWLQLPLMGLHPTAREVEDYIALFRYLGHLLAVPDKYFSFPAQARATMEAMIKYERKPTETSKVLCYNFVAALQDQAPYRISAGFIEAGARIINGDEMTDAEGLGKPGWMSYVYFWGFCWLCQFLVFFQKCFPSFDEYLIKVQKELFYAHMIEGSSSIFSLGGASKFPMKYNPRVGKLTKKEAAEKGEADNRFFVRPLETLFFVVFATRVIGTLLLYYGGVTLSVRLFRYALF